MTEQETQGSSDVLIIGGGLMGAAVARLLREGSEELQITMVDAGPEVGSVRGQHLHDSPEPEIWSHYNEMMSSGIQSSYVLEWASDFGSSPVDAVPGMYAIDAFGEVADEMPVAALGWNAGGMGVHWSAATPWPPADETPDFIDAEEWDADLNVAKRLLRVHDGPYEETAIAQVVEDRLNELLAGELNPERPVRPLPMALQPTDEGLLERTGPNVLFPAIRTGDDPNFTLHTATQAVRLERRGDAVVGAWVRPLGSAKEAFLSARVTIVCADAFRTPQLLFASGIRPTALGRYLNEHATIHAQTLVDLGPLGIDPGSIPHQHPGEYAVTQHWVRPNQDVLPAMGQFVDVVYRDERDNLLAYACGMTFYVKTDVNPHNRLEFLDDEKDVFGMPRIRVHFNWSDADLGRIDKMRAVQDRLGSALGTYDPEVDASVFGAGSSLHFTGTVRMGVEDDGTSVCDSHGRVWGIDGLYVAGNGVLPTAITCNSTLAGMVTAVRAARDVLA